MDCLNPDGTYTDDERARRRGISIGNQGFDGMSRLSGLLTPELRATLEAVLAKLAAPGMCNPTDENPVVDGEAPEEADQVAKYARVLMDCLNPDGTYTDDERARRRGISIGNQGFDGMSRLSGLLTPELRATLEAVLAKLAAPGMCNPTDENPVVDGEAPEEAVGALGVHPAAPFPPARADGTRCRRGAGGVRPVRGRQPQRAVGRRRATRAAGRGPQNLPFYLS